MICLICSTLQKRLTGFQGSVFNQISKKIRFHFTFVIKFVKEYFVMIEGVGMKSSVPPTKTQFLVVFVSCDVKIC